VAGLSVRNEVDMLKMECMHCNAGNIGTVYTVDGFWHSAQKAQCYSSLFCLEHIACCIHIGQPEPGAVDLNSFITIASDQIRLN